MIEVTYHLVIWVEKMTAALDKETGKWLSQEVRDSIFFDVVRVDGTELSRAGGCSPLAVGAPLVWRPQVAAGPSPQDGWGWGVLIVL